MSEPVIGHCAFGPLETKAVGKIMAKHIQRTVLAEGELELLRVENQALKSQIAHLHSHLDITQAKLDAERAKNEKLRKK